MHKGQEMSKLFDEICEISRIHAYCVTGDEKYLAPTPAMSAEQRLRAIVRAYDDCKDDPSARLPTVLSLLIEAAREHCGAGTQRAFKEDAGT